MYTHMYIHDKTKTQQNKEEEKARYKIKTLRADDEIWKQFQQKRRDSGLSWNIFIRGLLDK
jgi:hypothetical protein